MSVELLVLGRSEVEALLDPDQLVDALAEAMEDLSLGRVSMPPRVAATVPEHDGWLGAMLAHLPSAGVLAAKLVSVYPRNAEASLETHHAAILVFDPRTGVAQALLDGASVTAARTAAASALATRLLARRDARVLAVLGTGVQARAHVRTLTSVGSYERVVVASRDQEKSRRVADELAAEIGRPVEAVASYADALAVADVVCAATHSPEPVVRREWLRPGVHVNSVGYNAEGREVDEAVVVDALVVVESRAAALAPFPGGSNDLTWPVRDGSIGPEHVHAELGELVAGTRPGRTDPEQITLYKSVGVAVEDAAAAALVVRRARERSAGRTLLL